MMTATGGPLPGKRRTSFRSELLPHRVPSVFHRISGAPPVLSNTLSPAKKGHSCAGMSVKPDNSRQVLPPVGLSDVLYGMPAMLHPYRVDAGARCEYSVFVVGGRRL